MTTLFLFLGALRGLNGRVVGSAAESIVGSVDVDVYESGSRVVESSRWVLRAAEGMFVWLGGVPRR